VLGRTGLRVSEIGFGAWAIGGDQWGRQDDRESMAALHRALDLGCTFIDTAQVYGKGHSEELIGRVLGERRERVSVASKVPPKNQRWGPAPGADMRDYFPADYIVQRCEGSLRNLGTEALDVYQLHTWCPSWEHETEWYEAMLKLRQQGKIRYIGISLSDHRPGEANPHIEAGRVDTVQVIYNVLDQSPEWKLFPIAQRHKVGIIARVPLASGALTGKFTPRTRFPKGDWRGEWKDREWLKRMVRQVQRVEFLTRAGVPLAIAALKFVLGHPAVSTAIPGIRNTQQAELDLSASDGLPLPPEQLLRLRQMYLMGLLGAETSAG
jgi:aryl-alcohol dehydrogenase-like predicted oxidoreductase